MKYFLLLVLHFSLMTSAGAQVDIVEQQFDYTNFTCTLTLHNKGDKEVLLTSMSADYKVYIYTLWWGVGDPPRIKSSATYTLPIYLAPECLDSAHLTRVLNRNTPSEGYWECRSSIQTNPALLAPPHSKVKFEVQFMPIGYKAYWEMEVDVRLAMQFTDGQTTENSNIHILSEDIMGYFLADRVLNKDKILGILQKTQKEEFINLRSGFGKLEYSFNRHVAASHLDKIGLAPDSLRAWLLVLLHDDDARVKQAACKMIHKYHMTDMLDTLSALWNNMPAETGDAYLFYTLVALGDSGYVRASPEEFVTGRYDFTHLANQLDEPLFGKLTDLLQNHRDVFAKTGIDPGDYYKYLARYERPETERLLREALGPESKASAVDGILNALARKIRDNRPNDFVKKFKPEYRALAASGNYTDDISLLELICATEDDFDYLDHLLRRSMLNISPLQRQMTISDLLPSVGKRLAADTERSQHWLWRLHSPGNKAKWQQQDSLIGFTGALCSAAYLEQAAPEDALLLLSFLKETNLLDYRDKNRLYEQARSEIGQPAYLKKLSLPDLATLGNLLNLGYDTLATEHLESALAVRIRAKDFPKAPGALLTLAERLAKSAVELNYTYEKGARWYGFANACYAAIPHTYSKAAWQASGFCSDLAWYELEHGQPEKALEAAKDGMAWLERPSTVTRYAAALLLTGHSEEARAVYGKFKNELFNEAGWLSDRPFKEIFLQDLDALEKKKVVPEARKAEVEAIRELLKN